VNTTDQDFARGLSRRVFLRTAALSGAALLLAACGASGGQPSSGGAPTTAPSQPGPTQPLPTSRPISLATPSAATPAAAAPTAQIDLAAVKSEGKVVGYGVLIDSQWQALDQLAQQKLGIPVENFRGADPQVSSRLVTEKDGGRNLVDFVVSESIYLNRLITYLDKLPSEFLDRVPDKWRDPNGYWAIFTLFPTTVIFNTQLVSGSDAPKKLEDLLDPRFKGKIAITDPTLNPTFLRWFAVIQRQMADKADDFFKGLAAQNPTMFQSGLTVSTNVNEGQFAVGFGFMTHVLSVGGKNGHMDYLRQDPMPTANGALTWANKPPHPNAQRAITDVFLSQDYLQASGDLGYPITVPGVKSAIPGADSLNYQELPELPQDQLTQLGQYFKGIFSG
jgi:iron(III) transport system substrate-binding protein